MPRRSVGIDGKGIERLAEGHMDSRYVPLPSIPTPLRRCRRMRKSTPIKTGGLHLSAAAAAAASAMAAAHRRSTSMPLRVSLRAGRSISRLASRYVGLTVTAEGCGGPDTADDGSSSAPKPARCYETCSKMFGLLRTMKETAASSLSV